MQTRVVVALLIAFVGMANGPHWEAHHHAQLGMRELADHEASFHRQDIPRRSSRPQKPGPLGWHFHLIACRAALPTESAVSRAETERAVLDASVPANHPSRDLAVSLDWPASFEMSLSAAEARTRSKYVPSPALESLAQFNQHTHRRANVWLF